MAELPPWRGRLRRLSSRGYAGGVIKQHRAMLQIRRSRSTAAGGLLLPLFFTLVQAALLGPTLRLWRALFEFWSARLELGLRIGVRILHLGVAAVSLPQVSRVQVLFSSDAWWAILGACLLLFLSTYLVRPGRWLPLIYSVRAAVIVQGTALAVFALAPASFAWTAEDHVNTGLLVSVWLLFLIPWFLGLTHYLFDFPLRRKVVLTLVILAYFTLAMPVQYLLHLYVLQHCSLLLLPVLYLLFGLFLDVLLLVALYAWGMSWRWGQAREE